EGLALSKEMDEAPPVQLQPQGNASVPKNSAAGSGLENAEGGVASRGASKPIVNNTAAASDSIQLGSDDLESIEKLEQVIDELAHDLDPNMKREFQLSELVERTKEIEKLDRPESTGGFDKLDTTNRLKTLILANEGKDGKKFDDSEAYGRLEEALQKRNAQVRKAKSWKRVIAIPNTTRLLVGDKDELDLTGMQVNVQVDGFRARVLLDYFYYNDRAEQLEGNFKLRLPDDASLYYFAFGESAYDLTPKGGLAAEEFLGDGAQFVSLDAKQVREAREDRWRNVKESRMVPREKAAHAFRETVRRKVDPALVEWSGAGVFNARVFPMSPHKLHRIVIGYDVNLRKVDGQWVYELQLPENSGDCQVDLNVLPVENVEYSIEPKSDPFEEEVAGKKQRRYQFKSPNMKTIRLEANPASGESDAGASEKPPELMLHSADETEGEFWGVQLTPELPVAKLAGNPQAIFMLDTSLSSNPDKFNVWLKMLESTLTNNRESLQQFNVLFFNVDGHFWQPKWMDNTEANTNRLIEACNNLTLEGATDLYGAVEQVTNASWVRESADGSAEKPTSGPDLFLLSDGAANWGETNLRLIGGRLQDYQMGSLFAYQTGMTGTAISELRFLTGQTGGAVFSVASEAEIKLASTAHRKRPWKLASISAAGASDVMTAGRVQWVYPGQSITVVGRGTLAGSLELEFEQPGETKTMSFKPRRIESDLASRLYGQVAVGQLESLGSSVFDVAAAYSRHFRITGETCSLLMLDTEAEYERFDIKPQEDLFVIKTQLADAYVVKTLKKSAANLADPKAQLVAWLDRLETMPGMSFKLPTALKLALDDIRVVAVSKPLNCELATKDQVSKDYLDSILIERLDYEKIATEANRRGGSSVDEAVKVFSSLVERNPGDLVIARDVAYTALELGRPAQAYHLLRSVVKARPFEGSVYPALGQCLMQMGEADMAIVYYEVALGATFNRMGNDFKQIVSAEYMYLLRQVVDGRLESNVKEFAIARLETLKKTLKFESADVLISMMWNTDQTDVDLHIVEPNGEECSYENRRTRSGGNITSDITTGFGPEMYVNAEAPRGKYEIKVKYFANRQNRTELRNKVHLTIYRGFGTPAERVTRRTVLLKKVGEKESVATVGVD
ncbi:MAG: tetratricopeptide (TPR) repeat protein, partial [Mariniblastus sp.]